MAIVAVTATFTGAEDSVAVTWTALNTATPAVTAGVCLPDTTLGVVDADVTSVSATGCTIVPSDRFVGTVEVIAMDS